MIFAKNLSLMVITIMLFAVVEPDVEKWFQIALAFFLTVWLVSKTIIEGRNDENN